MQPLDTAGAGIHTNITQQKAVEEALAKAKTKLEAKDFKRAAGPECETGKNQVVRQSLHESESLYNSLVEHIPAAIFRKNLQGRYTFVNAWFCRMKELRPDQFIGKLPEELPGHKKALKVSTGTKVVFDNIMATQGTDDHNSIIATGQTIERDEEYPAHDGGRIYWHAIKCPVYDLDGKIIGSQGMIFDVTAAHRNESALAYERQLLRALIEHSYDCIYFKDLDSRFIRCSQKMAEIFGVKTIEQVMGKTDFDFFDIQHAQPAYDDEQEIIRTGQPMIGKIELEVWPDGHETWALTSKMPLRNTQGEIIGTFGISKDITAIKKTEKELAEVHKQLVEASRKAGMAEVATGVLHNVGNVLNSVNVSATLVGDTLRATKTTSLGKVAALLDEHTGDLATFLTSDPRGIKVPGYLRDLCKHLIEEQKTCLAEVDALRKNIDHIKDIVAMQQTYATVSGMKDEVKLHELAEDALRINAASLLRHNIQVTREFEPLPAILADKHKVMQILVNLITNATHACDEKLSTESCELKAISVRTFSGKGSVKIAITDNGIGIPHENLTSIFNYGFTTKKDGHGFGLHTSANAAKEMDGSLSAQSDGRGKGATFILELPINNPKDRPEFEV